MIAVVNILENATYDTTEILSLRATDASLVHPCSTKHGILEMREQCCKQDCLEAKTLFQPRAVGQSPKRHLRAKMFVQHYNARMKRTLITIGNSIAVTIPREFLERHGLNVGDIVELEVTERGIMIRPERVLDTDFERAFRSVVRRYRGTLQQLAERDRKRRKS